MPQEFQILRCYACEVFNVDIVKKFSNKWSCKMCGEKQSVKHVYGTSSSASECREYVQHLNQQRGSKADEIPEEPALQESVENSQITMVGQVSRWAKYMVDIKDDKE